MGSGKIQERPWRVESGSMRDTLLDAMVREMEEEQQKAALINSLNDRQKEVLNILNNEWTNGQKSTVEMITGSLLGAKPNEDSKQKVLATLDQLKGKVLANKDILIDD
jgi:hypothetical protein